MSMPPTVITHITTLLYHVPKSRMAGTKLPTYKPKTCAHADCEEEIQDYPLYCAEHTHPYFYWKARDAKITVDDIPKSNQWPGNDPDNVTDKATDELLNSHASLDDLKRVFEESYSSEDMKLEGRYYIGGACEIFNAKHACTLRTGEWKVYAEHDGHILAYLAGSENAVLNHDYTTRACENLGFITDAAIVRSHGLALKQIEEEIKDGVMAEHEPEYGNKVFRMCDHLGVVMGNNEDLDVAYVYTAFNDKSELIAFMISGAGPEMTVVVSADGKLLVPDA